MSRSKIYGGVVDSHATSNPAISDVKSGENRIKSESLSLMHKLLFLRDNHIPVLKIKSTYTIK